MRGVKYARTGGSRQPPKDPSAPKDPCGGEGGAPLAEERPTHGLSRTRAGQAGHKAKGRGAGPRQGKGRARQARPSDQGRERLAVRQRRGVAAVPAGRLDVRCRCRCSMLDVEPHGREVRARPHPLRRPELRAHSDPCIVPSGGPARGSGRSVRIDRDVDVPVGYPVVGVVRRQFHFLFRDHDSVPVAV